jgi:DNA gyrase subunit A
MKLKPEESIATISKVYKEDTVDDLEEGGENQVNLVDTTEKE